MSRDPAGAVIFSAFQRIECFCRTRIFLWPMRHQFAVFLGVLALASSAGAGSETATTSSSAPRFTLRQAIERAFQHNPAILTARQEIRRTKGVQIQVRAEAIPHLDASGMFNHIAPSLRVGTESAFSLSDNSYNVNLTGSQLIYNGSVIPAIKGAAAATDASLYALRNTIDQVIATVRQQFYQVILNKVANRCAGGIGSSIGGPAEGSAESLRSRYCAAIQRFAGGSRFGQPATGADYGAE